MTTTHSDHPLVSCLCVTWKRAAKLERAIRLFLGQSYPHRELVIVHQDDDAETRALVSEYEQRFAGPGSQGATGPTIRGVPVPASPRLQLGQLRNVAIDAARGEYFCQWDDDDWCHRDRLARQISAVTDNFQTAAVLTNLLMFDGREKRAYLSEFRLWEGTVLCRRDAIDESLRYPTRGIAEDSIFLNNLAARTGVYPVVAPNLYIYEIHQSNTWHPQHFDHMLSKSLPLSPAVSGLLDDILHEKHTLDEASRRLSDPAFLREVKYFHPKNINAPNDEVEEYIEWVRGGADV